MQTTIDTRDLYKRKCELEELRDTLNEAQDALRDAENALAAFRPDEDAEQEENDEAHAELEEAVTDAQSDLDAASAYFGEDEEAELAELETLENEITDFMHGETMIREDSFEDYARELAEDLHGQAIRDASWPFTCINWSDAADELRQDYTEVGYQGHTYLVRA